MALAYVFVPLDFKPLILQLLAEKKYQYQNLTVKFDHHFSQVGNFAWIQIDPIALKRMLSNSLNNAVDALNQQEGRITLHLDADHEQVTITVEDNGKGMRPELVQKILNQGAVTEGKANGHGIGLTQARETLQNHQGRWAIDSQVGIGTKILFTFPRAQAQNWIAENIQLNNDDTVVILDDDSSIHLAWDTRFDRILKEFPNLTVKHFEEGQETVDFINGLTPEKKQKIFLLTDYELLKQELNGLDVIKKTHIYRSILVTSHYVNKAVREEAAGTGTRILPKQLASDIPINHAQTHLDQHAQKTGAGSKKVVAVFIDDDQALLDSFTFFAANKKIDTYHDPQHFLDNSMHYEKQTKIFIDYCFSNFDKNGIQLAGKLHDLGFTQLYLLSGMSFSNKPVPDYLTVISKTDLNKLKSVLNSG